MDPLRPFSDLIRSLWKSNAPRVDRPTGAPASQATNPGPADTAVEDEGVGLVALKSEIRSRLGQVGLADPHRTREVFVEVVMARELGLGPEHDEEFSSIARRVAAQIASNPRLSERLHVLLMALAEGRSID